MEEKIYLRIVDGKLYRTDDLSEADYIRLSIDTWNNLKSKYMALKNRLKIIKENHIVTKEEYHGYQNALRIINDRSIQQIDREKADAHGYTLRYADQRVLDRSCPDQKAFVISKITPISLHVDLETAFFLIKQDLKKYYHFADIKQTRIRPVDILKAIPQRDDPSWNEEFYVDNSEYGRQIYMFLDDVPQCFIFDIFNIRSNIGQGVYEVSYWATGII